MRRALLVTALVYARETSSSVEKEGLQSEPAGATFPLNQGLPCAPLAL